MKLLLFYSYFTVGFAYAGEALVGRYIGSKEKDKLLRTIMLDFNWSIAIGIVSTVVYAVAGRAMVSIFSDDPAVIAGCEPYLFWLVLMPVISCVAFTWDGIYIGATRTRQMFISLLLGALLFFVSDSTLFYIRFKKNSVFKTHFVAMLTYIIGEFLIIEGFVLLAL